MKKPSSRAKQTWRRLAQFYGSRLAEQYGPECPPDWCAVIDRTDPERLELAMLAVRRDHLNYPPTLGQFEAAIPKKQFGNNAVPVHERLCDHALRTINLCEHQLWRPWSYFGRTVEDGTRTGYLQTNGVVIPACPEESCRKYGQGHRIIESEL